MVPTAKISNLVHLGQTKFKRCILNASFEFNTAQNIIDKRHPNHLLASGKAEIAKIYRIYSCIGRNFFLIFFVQKLGCNLYGGHT